MIAQYQVQKLNGHQQIDPAEVLFESTDACPVCASTDLVDVSVLTDSLITAWCLGCRHLFHRRKPTPGWYRDWYARLWDTADPSQDAMGDTPPALHSPRGSLFYFCRPAIEPGYAVLDLGCGYGNDLVPFIEFGCDAFGIEASPHRARAAEAAGVSTANVSAEELTEQTFGRRFDLVLSNHVLEHIYDPHTYLRSVRRVLEPGGWLCLSVPNAANDFMLHNFFFALHIHFFSRYSLETLLAAHGFVVHRVLEEHQLRVLTRYEPVPDHPDEVIPPECSIHACEPPLDAILSSAFGRRDPEQNRAIHCHWTESATRLRTAYDVTHDDSPRPDSPRAMSVTLDGDPRLPIIFRSNHPGGVAPFWAK